MNTSREIGLPRHVLEAAFPDHQVKSRPGAFGHALSYLEGHTVIARLNEALDGLWSFEVTNHQVLDGEVLVLGRFRVESAGLVKMAFGSSKITRDSQTGEPANLGDDLKAASTDALKKAATLVGVGLYLYGGGNGHTTNSPAPDFADKGGQPPATGGNGHRQPQGNGASRQPGSGNGRVTNRQISAIFSIARQKGMSNDEVRSLCRQTFNRTIDYLGRGQASQLIEHLLDR